PHSCQCPISPENDTLGCQAHPRPCAVVAVLYMAWNVNGWNSQPQVWPPGQSVSTEHVVPGLALHTPFVLRVVLCLKPLAALATMKPERPDVWSAMSTRMPFAVSWMVTRRVSPLDMSSNGPLEAPLRLT